MGMKRRHKTVLGMGMAVLVCAAGAHDQQHGTGLTMPSGGSAGSMLGVMAIKRGEAPVPIPYVPAKKQKHAQASASFRRVDGVTRATAPTGRFFVMLKQPSVVQHLAQSRVARGDHQPLSLRSAEATRYESQIQQDQQAALASFDRLLGRSLVPKRRFTKALNGFSIQMSEREAALLATDAVVASVRPVVNERLQTDAGPALIGAPAIWDGSATGVATLGEGITVGIIDSGINSDHPSFAENAGGFMHTNPFGTGNYRGWCAEPANAGFCNDKLIGAYDFVYDLVAGEPDTLEEASPEDNDGHGSHTASTAAGNPLTVSYNGIAGIDISGVAPHANIIAYDTCYAVPSTGQGLCPDDATAMAVEQAIADGVVDVINFSIGGGVYPYSDLVSEAFLAATEMGIYVAASAGNDGPDPGTLSHQEPWVATTAASTHNRQFRGNVAVTGPGAPPAELTDIAYVQSSGVPVVTSIEKPLQDVADIAPADPQGCSAYAGTPLLDRIALIERGECNFSVKVTHAQNAGAAAVVVYNNVPGAAFRMSALDDPSITIPAVMIEQDDGVALAAFGASNPATTVAVNPVSKVNTGLADRIADFSSRGPNSTLDVLKPDLAAPGVDILAAVADGGGLGTPGTELDVYSGTSMASPHHAGAVALLQALQPTWTPMELKSALMLTAKTAGVVKEDGGTPADAFDHGSGRVQVANAANAGLVMDETMAAFVAADPDEGGDPRALNLASLYSSNCLATINCVFERRFTNPHSTATTWHIAFEQPDGVTLEASPSTITVQPGATASVTFTADASELDNADGFRFGAVILTEESATFEPLHMNVAIQAADGFLPDVVTIPTGRDAGIHVLEGLMVPPVTDLTFVPSGLVRGTKVVEALQEDSTDSPFDDLDDGVWYTIVEPTQFGVRFVAEILASEAVDLDLYLGEDLNDDGMPQAGELLAVSAGVTALERAELRNLSSDRNYWILVKNYSSGIDGPAEFTLSHGFVGLADAGSLSVDAPATPAPGVPFDAALHFNEPQMHAGERWYGALDVGSDENAAQIPDIGTIGVDVIRNDDVVIKTADVDEAVVGDVVTYTIAIAPNHSAEDLAYTVQDTLPAGLTLVPGSVQASVGQVLENGNALTWTLSQMPASFEYAVSTSQTDDTCAVPFANHGAYADFAAYGLGPNPLIDGEGPYQQPLAGSGMPYYGGEHQPTLFFGANGALSFDLASIFAEGNGDSQPIPLTTAPNALLAPLWADMVIDPNLGSGVTLVETFDPDDAPIANILEFDHLLLASDAGNASSIDLEVYLDSRIQDSSPEMVFAYANPTGDFASLLQGTIGIENVDGSEGIEIAHNDAGLQVDDGFAICFDLVTDLASSPVLTYQATVDAFEGAPRLLTNTVVHDNDADGSVPESTSWSVLASALPGSADLAVSIVEAPESVVAGGQITYAINVHNNGADAADDVAMNISLPAGLSYAGASGENWSCISAATVECVLTGALADAMTSTLELTVNVSPNALGDVTTVVSVATSTDDPVAGNDSASATTTVLLPPDRIFGDGFED